MSKLVINVRVGRSCPISMSLIVRNGLQLPMSYKPSKNVWMMWQVHRSPDGLVRQQLCSTTTHDQGLQLQGLGVDPTTAGRWPNCRERPSFLQTFFYLRPWHPWHTVQDKPGYSKPTPSGTSLLALTPKRGGGCRRTISIVCLGSRKYVCPKECCLLLQVHELVGIYK